MEQAISTEPVRAEAAVSAIEALPLSATGTGQASERSILGSGFSDQSEKGETMGLRFNIYALASIGFAYFVVNHACSCFVVASGGGSGPTPTPRVVLSHLA
jgi:hypothetical protein